MRGPRTRPFSTAVFTPRSDPPASRTDVMPVRKVASILATAWKYLRENGRIMDFTKSNSPLMVKCTWVSNRPGSSVRPPRSTSSSPSRPTPRSTMSPPSTTTSAGAGAAPVPSKIEPPRNNVLVILTLQTDPGSCARWKANWYRSKGNLSSFALGCTFALAQERHSAPAGRPNSSRNGSLVTIKPPWEVLNRHQARQNQPDFEHSGGPDPPRRAGPVQVLVGGHPLRARGGLDAQDRPVTRAFPARRW